jgi:hypothetical protein
MKMLNLLDRANLVYNHILATPGMDFSIPYPGTGIVQYSIPPFTSVRLRFEGRSTVIVRNVEDRQKLRMQPWAGANHDRLLATTSDTVGVDFRFPGSYYPFILGAIYRALKMDDAPYIALCDGTYDNVYLGNQDSPVYTKLQAARDKLMMGEAGRVEGLEIAEAELIHFTS